MCKEEYIECVNILYPKVIRMIKNSGYYDIFRQQYPVEYSNKKYNTLLDLTKYFVIHIYNHLDEFKENIGCRWAIRTDNGWENMLDVPKIGQNKRDTFLYIFGGSFNITFVDSQYWGICYKLYLKFEEMLNKEIELIEKELLTVN